MVCNWFKAVKLFLCGTDEELLVIQEALHTCKTEIAKLSSMQKAYTIELANKQDKVGA